jgi:hypothetical protein
MKDWRKIIVAVMKSRAGRKFHTTCATLFTNVVNTDNIASFRLNDFLANQADVPADEGFFSIGQLDYQVIHKNIGI